ncbi:MAG: FAD:protein FMN transferase, partial [Coriobacteriia bacterium]|nr:FAD:protein FMN transferase [Coriobacteriia bacterium]
AASVDATALINRRSFIKKSGLVSVSLASLLSGCALANESKQGPNTTNESQGKLQSDTGTKSGITIDENEPLTASTFAFDTLVMLSSYGNQEVLDRCIEECARFDTLLSAHTEGSDVWKINHAGGKPTKVSADTAACIQDSLVYCEKSKGVFDITIGSVSLLWDFVSGVKPSEEAIQEGLTHIDYTKVQVDGTVVTLEDPKAQLDLGGSAKGFIADKLAQIYRDAGASGIINLGGNVYCIGKKPDGSKYRVAVKDPNDPNQKFLLVLELEDSSIVTSGLYERNFVVDDTMYYHILDINTGYPAQTDLVADTLVSKSSTECDCYSTTLFILGLEEGKSFIEGVDEIEGFFVNENNEVVFTSGFKEQYPYELEEGIVEVSL